MKRDLNIMPLSREHHFGLLFCWKIRQGLKNNIELSRISSYIDHFWTTHLQQHFIEEETILFNQIKDKLCDEALAQHNEIIKQIDIIDTDKKNDPVSYNALADMVDEHIRFEERELFPHLESILSAEMLSDIGVQLNKVHKIDTVAEYMDEFWIKK